MACRSPCFRAPVLASRSFVSPETLGAWLTLARLAATMGRTTEHTPNIHLGVCSVADNH